MGSALWPGCAGHAMGLGFGSARRPLPKEWAAPARVLNMMTKVGSALAVSSGYDQGVPVSDTGMWGSGLILSKIYGLRSCAPTRSRHATERCAARVQF